MAQINWYEGPLDLLLRNPIGSVGRYMKYRGLKIVAGAKAQVGVDTGALRASIHMRHKRNPRYQYIEVAATTKYAYMHHEGTKPHIITPSRRTVLRFVTKGVLVRTLLVNHPGTRANRYLRDQLKYE
jgi:hypothetical protein